jgi:N-acyl-L-homoserine lactone synthetase
LIKIKTAFMKNINCENPASSISYEIAHSEEMIREAKHLCHDVYLLAGYIDAPFPGNKIPHEYDAMSVYIVALDHLRCVVGTVRLTSGVPFKTLDVWKGRLYLNCAELIREVAEGNSFEIGALAVRKDLSPLKISWELYKTVFKYALTMNLDHAVISIDARALRTLEILGWHAIRIGDPIYYFGSMTVPCVMPVKSQLCAVELKNQTYYKLLAA